MKRVAWLIALALFPLLAVAAEMVDNPTSPEAWKLETPEGGAALREEQGALRVDVRTATPEPWRIQIYQQDKSLFASRSYTLRFSARASRARTITLGSQLQESPWTSFWYKSDVQVGTTYERYEFSFMPDRNTDGRGRMPMFVLGASAGTIWLKDISVRETNEPAPSAAPAAPIAPPVVVIAPGEQKQATGKLELDVAPDAKAEQSQDGDAVRFNVQQGGSAKSAVQVFMFRPELAAGKYVVTFSAKADPPRSVDLVAVQSSAAPFDQITAAAPVQVPADWQKFVVRFRLPSPADEVRSPSIQLGGTAGTVWIKDCSVEPDASR